MKELDPNGGSSIGFDVFVDYMTRELTDMDTSDQLLQSFRTVSGEKVCWLTSPFLAWIHASLIAFLIPLHRAI